MELADRMGDCIERHRLAGPLTPVLLMVSGGSDSTALAYLATELRERGDLGALGILHVNHRLRGADADADERFVSSLADFLGIRLLICSVDVGELARQEGGNVEAVARRVRYQAADRALSELCRHASIPFSEGRIFTAHTADDRVENFYMRSIVGTGPGGFRAMRYLNGHVARPLLNISRQELRAYLQKRGDLGSPIVRDEAGSLWREDATNAHTDRFRAFVRHEIVPLAKKRNPQLLQTLTRTMDLIADEDDLLRAQTRCVVDEHVSWLAREDSDESAGCLLAPSFGEVPVPLARRAVYEILRYLLGGDARVETASVEAVLNAFAPGDAERAAPGDAGAKERSDVFKGVGVLRSGYVCNIQGNLAISANKHGVRIEPMECFRARRKRS